MIIAECGTWHKGRHARAVQLMEWATTLGADAVKFQMFVPREPLFCPRPGDENRWRYWNKSLMSLDTWKELRESCSIKFILSVFQPTAVQWLKEIKPDYVKVASRAALTFPYSELDGPFIISTGMCEGQDTNRLANRLLSQEKEFWFLQCVSKYPTPLNESEWNRAYRGLSDHSGTPWPAIHALAHGAKIIEVHFTHRHDPKWPDYWVSLNPAEFKMVCDAKRAFASMRSH